MRMKSRWVRLNSVIIVLPDLSLERVNAIRDGSASTKPREEGLMAIGLINQAAYAHYGRYASTGYPSPRFSGCRGFGDGAEYTFGCGIIIVTRPFFGRHRRDAVRRTVQVSRMGFGHLARVINVAQGDPVLCSQARQDASSRTSTRPLWETAIGICDPTISFAAGSDELCVTSPGLKRARRSGEWLRTKNAATVRCRDRSAQIRHHLATVAHAQHGGVCGRWRGFEFVARRWLNR